MIGTSRCTLIKRKKLLINNLNSFFLFPRATPNEKPNRPRIFFPSLGTMKLRLDFNYLDHSKCHLYSFKDMKKKKLLDGVSISNGLAWSLDETVLYFVDSPKYRIDSYQYDKDTIELSKSNYQQIHTIRDVKSFKSFSSIFMRQ